MTESERPSRRIRRAATRLRGRAAKRPLVTSIIAFLGLLGTLTLQWAVPKVLDTASSRIGEEVQSDDPIDVAVSSGAITFYHLSSLPRSYIIPKPMEDVTAAVSKADDMYDPTWKYAMGGVDADFTEVQIVLEGRDDKPVIVQDLKIRVAERREPLAGVKLNEVGGDLLDVRYASVDLDSSSLRLDLGEGYEEGVGEWSFPLRVSGTEQEVLHLFANTSNCYCFWEAELFYLYEGEQGSVIIDDDGQPFETTSSANATMCQDTLGDVFACN